MVKIIYIRSKFVDSNINSNTCLNCGGQMKFDPVTQALLCQSCRQSSKEEAVDPAFDCPNCGAGLTIIAGSRQSKCEFCGGSFAMLLDGEDCELTGEIPDNHKYIIPFTVSKDEYQKGMIAWLAGENLTPTDAFNKIGIIKSEGKYIPHYYCIANFNGSYTASIGHDRVESYIAHVQQRDAKGRVRSVPVTRTRTVTDWRPFQSQIKGTSTYLCEASDSIKDIASKTHAATPEKWRLGVEQSTNGLYEPLNIQIERKQSYDVKFTAGYSVLACDKPHSIVYDKGKVQQDIHRQIQKVAPGDRIRDIHFMGSIVPDYFLIYRPSWMTVYSYEDKICFNTCDGTNPTRHYGTRPVDKDKKRRLANIRKWMISSFIVFAVTLVGSMLVYGGLQAFLTVAAMLSAVSSLGLSIGYFVSYRTHVSKGKQTNAETAKRYLANPDLLFSRRSAKADPTL